MPKVKSVRRVSRPIPGVIDGAEWEVRGNASKQGSVDIKGHVMNVPLGVDPVERIIKNHEMLHVKFSPKRPAPLPGTDINAYQACEDARINYRGRYLSVDTGSVTVYDDHDIERLKKNIAAAPNPELLAASLLVATFGSVDRMRVLNEVLPDVFDDEEVAQIRYAADDAAYQAMRGTRPSHLKAKNAAKWLTERFAMPPEPTKNDNTSGKEAGDNSPSEVRKSLERTARNADFSELEKAEKGLTEKSGSDPTPTGQAPTGMTATGAQWWGKMKVVEPPRSQRFPSKMRARNWKPSDMGSVLRYPQRYCAGDGTIFAAKGQKLGGCTVLIDASGSMSLSQEDILQIMKLMPAATIASYCGESVQGELRILAKKGRRVADRDMRNYDWGGNCVDGPALDWLAKQPGPRYWVSDGQIVGYQYARTPAMYAAVYKHCRDHHILRVPSLKDVVDRFGGK